MKIAEFRVKTGCVRAKTDPPDRRVERSNARKMSGKRIMVADADESSSELFRQVLGDSWEVVSANNGIDALAQIERQPCSVVVADLNLPEFDGPQLLNRVREKYPK